MIDEADLILSYGHDEDVRQILGGNHLPKVFQSFLMSATMTKDVEALKGLILRSPVSRPLRCRLQTHADILGDPSFRGGRRHHLTTKSILYPVWPQFLKRFLD